MSSASRVANITFRSFVASLSRLIRLCLWVALATSAIVLGSQPGAGQSPDDVVRIDTSLVQLNIGVADKQGKPITDLQRNNFTVFEDGVRQNVMSFESSTTPFSLALLLDTSGSTLSFRQNLQLAAFRFIDALAPEDRVAVIGFNERAELLTKFTADRKQIAWAIDRAEGRGGTELYAALDYALKQLAGEGKRRKAIIVLTDGLDTSMRNLDRAASAKASTDEEAVAAIKPEANRSFSAVLDAADRQGVTIYPLALPSGDLKRLPIVSPQITAIYTAARARLDALARRTGGQVSDIRQLQDLAKTYAAVAADLRTLYTVSYQSSGARERDGRWRAIRIEIDRPELIARTRPGYYAR
jgi:Ca-activated chloride channel family protein